VDCCSPIYISHATLFEFRPNQKTAKRVKTFARPPLKFKFTTSYDVNIVRFKQLHEKSDRGVSCTVKHCYTILIPEILEFVLFGNVPLLEAGEAIIHLTHIGCAMQSMQSDGR